MRKAINAVEAVTALQRNLVCVSSRKHCGKLCCSGQKKSAPRIPQGLRLSPTHGQPIPNASNHQKFVGLASFCCIYAAFLLHFQAANPDLA